MVKQIFTSWKLYSAAPIWARSSDRHHYAKQTDLKKNCWLCFLNKGAASFSQLFHWHFVSLNLIMRTLPASLPYRSAEYNFFRAIFSMVLCIFVTELGEFCFKQLFFRVKLAITWLSGFFRLACLRLYIAFMSQECASNSIQVYKMTFLVPRNGLYWYFFSKFSYSVTYSNTSKGTSTSWTCALHFSISLMLSIIEFLKKNTQNSVK